MLREVRGGSIYGLTRNCPELRLTSRPGSSRMASCHGSAGIEYEGAIYHVLTTLALGEIAAPAADGGQEEPERETPPREKDP